MFQAQAYRAKQVAEDTAKLVGTPKANDGHAAQLGPGALHGGREQTAQQIAQQQSQLDRDIAGLDRQISELGSSVGQKSGLAAVASTIGGAILGPLAKLGIHTGLEAASGVDAERAQLQAKRDELTKARSELARTQQQSENERRLNFLANTASATGMPASVQATLDGRGHVAIDTVAQTTTGGESESAKFQHNVSIGAATARDIDQRMRVLQQQGVVDAHGNITDVRRFDQSRVADGVIQDAALVGVHEMVHQAQDVSGVTDDRTRELQAYRAEEAVERQAGVVKHAPLTTNADGTSLPDAQASANVQAHEAGQPLPFGPAAGTVTNPQPMVTSETDDGGRHSPGTPSAGSPSPGRHSPGTPSPGRHSPGTTTQ